VAEPRKLRSAYGRLPFKEQIAFFRNKAPLPTESWTQLYAAGHDHGFVVAGANRENLVMDFMRAVDEVIADGKSLEHFRKNFDQIVKSHGWDYHGERNWRSKVIYQTNLMSSFAAGRRGQLLDMRETHPYWMYVHSDAVKHPRAEHQAWDGMVLRWDDPFWQTHFPPNGWGCQCEVRALTERQARAMGKSGPDTAPPIAMREVTVGTTGPSPRTVQVPVGIDPGFEYAPGAMRKPGSNGYLQRQAWEAMEFEPDLEKSKWEGLVETTAADAGHREQLPQVKWSMPLAPYPEPGESMVQRVRDAIGADTKTFNVHGMPVTIDAQALGGHLTKDPKRARYLPMLPDLLQNPQEVWINLFRNKKTGHYELRTRIIKVYTIEGDKSGRGLLAVAQAGKGFFKSWTFTPTRNLDYINRQRKGKVWYVAPELVGK